MSNDKVLLIPKIEKGFVLDHIPAGAGIKVLGLIQKHRELDEVVISVGLHYTSDRLGRKDIIKLQCQKLPQRFLQYLSLLVPGITVKKISDFAIAKKITLEPPELIDNLLTCPNSDCITNHETAVSTCFYLMNRNPMKFRCNYCERWFNMADLENRPARPGMML